jgi:AraC family transcriptional regulator of arabinose operon
MRAAERYQLLVSGWTRRGPGFRIRRPHGTPDWLLIYTVHGSGRFVAAGDVVECSPGDALLWPPGALQDYRTGTAGHWELLWAHFVPAEEWSGWLPRGPGGDPAQVHFEGAERRRLTDTLMALPPARTQSDVGRRLADLRLQEVGLMLAIAGRQQPTGVNSIDRRLDRDMATVGNDPRARHSARTLAQVAGVSPSRLAHLAREVTGSSLGTVIREIRIRHAARMLELTDLPVGIIADEIGLSPPSYFSRVFRRSTGLSPRAYREAKARSQA